MTTTWRMVPISVHGSDTEVRVPFHKRRRDGSAVERAREGMRLLIAAGVPPTQMLLRDLGYGGDSAKRAIAAGPTAAPGAAGGGD
jgi:hypothetical protein